MNFRSPALRTLQVAMFAAVAAALVIPSAVQAQEEATGSSKTVAVIAASGVDQLLNDIDFVGNLAGAPSVRQQAEGMLLLFTGNNKLPGVDDTKVWGAIISTDGTNFEPILCVPVTDLGALLNMLQNFQMNVTDLGDGLSELELPNQSLYIKESNGWAFAAPTPESLDEVPADPAQTLSKVAGEYDLGIRIMMPNIPPMYREIAITNLRAGMEDGLEQGEDESDEDFAKREEAAEKQFDEIRRVFDEINEMTFGLNIDPDNKSLLFDFTYTAVPGTRTARELENFSSTQTRFSKLLKPDAMIQFNTANKVAQEDLAAYQAELDAALLSNRATILQQLDDNEDVSEEDREVVRKLLPPAMDLLGSILRDGKVDLVGNVMLAEGKVNGVGAAAGNTAEAAKLLDAIEEVAKEHPEKVTFTRDSSTHGGVALHELSFPLPEEADDRARELLGGDHAKVYIGVGSDALYVAAGADALTTIQEAIDTTEETANTEVPPVQFKLAFGPALEEAMKGEEFAGNPAAEELAKKLIEGGHDKIIMTLEKVGEMGRGRITIEQGVIEGISRMIRLGAEMAQ